MPIKLARVEKGFTRLRFYSSELRPFVVRTILGCSYFLLCSLAVAGNTSVDLDYSILHDSNFLRAESAQEETIHLAALGLKGGVDISKQRVKAALKFNQTYYENYQELDSSYVLGEADWRGQIGKKLLIDAAIKRDVYAVDPLEYQAKDLVSKNEFLARVGYGTREKLSVWLGGAEVNQSHSAVEREILDFDQQTLLVEIIARNTDGLQHQLQFSRGERQYKTGLNSAGDVIDFDYRQYAYDVKWIKNPANQFSLGVARFDREGEVNSDSGLVWDAQWLWQATTKLSVQLGFELNEPAAGEEIDTPTELKDTSLALRWQLAQRWRLETNFLNSEQKYITQTTLIERDEIWRRWRPLVLVYSSAHRFNAKLETELYERQSNTGLREYEGEKVTLSFALHF